MQFKLKKTITRVTVLSALLPTLPFLAADAFAHERAVPTSKMDPATALGRGSYAYHSFGNTVRSGYTRECVATGFWAPETATVECHPDFFASPLKPAPQAAAPEPAPAQAPTEYESATYAEPPDYEPATYADPAEIAPVAVAAELPDFAPEGDPPDMLPVPSPDSFAADAADDRISEPVMFYDEDGGAVADETILGVTQFGSDDSGIEPDDGITARQDYGDDDAITDDGIVDRQYYGDEEGVADDGIVDRQYYGDEAVAADDGIVDRQYYGDEAAAADDGIVDRQYYGDEAAAADDGIVDRQYYDDDGAVADDGIVARQEYDDFTDEPEVAQDEDAGFPEFVDDTAEVEDEPFVEESFVDDTGGEESAQAEEEPTEGAVAQVTEPEETKPVVLPVTITLDAEALFDFDRSLVRSDDRDKLDELVGGLQGVEYDTIIVVGHADRIGTRTYNQRLSERRAVAVKSYLVKKGVSDERIQTEGRGEFEPSSDPSTCEGMRKQKLIDCLQPDRRVEVTVTGQKPRE